MSSLSQGQTLRLRAKSGLINGLVGRVTPELLVAYRSVSAPGAVGVRLFTAKKPCRVVMIDMTHTTSGAGASVVAIHKHLAAHVAAPSAALATTNIVLVSSIPADATVNVEQEATLSTVDGVLSLATGDKLMAVFPATIAGILLQVYVVWTS